MDCIRRGHKVWRKVLVCIFKFQKGREDADKLLVKRHKISTKNRDDKIYKLPMGDLSTLLLNLRDNSCYK